MSENKKIVKKYIDGFEKSDHKQILSCLTEDVIWLIPGMFRKKGKKKFDSEIENENFVGSPVSRLSNSFKIFAQFGGPGVYGNFFC